MVKVKQVRRILGVVALAEELGVSRGHLYRVINGRRGASARVLAALAERGVPVAARKGVRP